MPTAKRFVSSRSAGKVPPRRAGDAAAKRRRIWWWGIGIAAALVVLALTVLALCFSSLRSLPLSPLTERHYLLIGRLSNQLTREVLRRHPRAEATLRLSVDEVNTLLEFARHTAYAAGTDVPPPESFVIAYRPDGAFTFTVPVDAAPNWCFGGMLYLSGRFHFEKQDEKLIVDVPELRFGRAELPVPGGGAYLREASADAVRESLPPEFAAAVKSLYSERDGTLVIVYRPREMQNLLPLLFKK